jgi:dsDNA-specific endonuclease/ATPase MutS2
MSESRSIDLHNFTVAEALREFVRFYNACVKSGYRGRLEVIHGYGSMGGGGVIREELRKYLKAHAETFGEFLAGESLRNPGVTILYPGDSLAMIPHGPNAGFSSIPRMKPPRKRR